MHTLDKLELLTTCFAI